MTMTCAYRSPSLGRTALLIIAALVTTTATIPLAAQQRAPASVPATAGASANAAAPARPPRPAETVTGTGPNGAKMRCKDGSYQPVSAPDSACEAKGGVLVRFPLRRVPERAPRPPLISAPAVTAAAPDSGAARAATERGPKGAVAAPRPPDGATLMCGDGSFIVADSSPARCAGKGGVSVIYPERRRP